MLKRVILAAALATCLASTAHAETNRQIHERCAFDSNYEGFYKIYVNAIVRTLGPLSALSQCLPSGISRADIEDALFLQMQETLTMNPRDLNLNPVQLYDQMMSDWWNCPSIYEVHRGAAILKDLKKLKTGANDVKKPLKDDEEMMEMLKAE